MDGQEAREPSFSLPSQPSDLGGLIRALRTSGSIFIHSITYYGVPFMCLARGIKVINLNNGLYINITGVEVINIK